MNQQDRFGNIHSRQTYYYLDRADPNPDGSPKLKSASTLTPAQIAQLGAVKVKTLLLKDNDCGVSKSNVAMQAGLLDRVAHIDPETYRHVLQFDATAGSPKTSRFFPPRTRLHFQRLCQYSQEPKGRGNQAPSKVYRGSPEARSGHASPLLWTTIDSRELRVNGGRYQTIEVTIKWSGSPVIEGLFGVLPDEGPMNTELPDVNEFEQVARSKDISQLISEQHSPLLDGYEKSN